MNEWMHEVIGSTEKPETFFKLNDTSYIYRRNLKPMLNTDGIINGWEADSRIVTVSEYMDIKANTNEDIKETLDAIMYALADIYEKLGVK